MLASGASLAWGSADYLAGISCRRLSLPWVLLVSQALGLVILGAVLVITGTPPPGATDLGLALASGALNAAALAAFYRGLARGPIGLVAPIAATEAVIPVAVGLAKGERPSAAAALGIALAVGGVVLASRAAGGETVRGATARSQAPSVLLGLVAAVCFGGFVVALKGASHGGTLWAVTASRAATAGLLAAVVSARRSAFTVKRSDVSPILAVGALDVGALSLFAVAVTAGPLSVVGVVGSLYPVVTILLAAFLLRERLGTWQRLGTLGALAGVALISAG